MWEVIMKLWFAIIIFPGLVINEGYKKLKAFLWKRYGIKWDWYKMTLVFAIILLVILLLNDYHW